MTKSWSPIQRKMLTVLEDGEWHTTHELHDCLDDELAGKTAVPYHISIIRDKLDRNSLTVATMRMNGETYYRQTRLIAGSGS